MSRENHIDPDNPHSNRSDHGKNHGYGRIAHSPQRSRKKIHNTTEKIRNCGKGKNLQTAGYHICLAGIDPEKTGTKKPGSKAQTEGNSYGKNHAVYKNFVHSFQFSHSVILTGKAHTCLSNRIGCSIKETKNIVGSRISCHGNRAKGIYRGLQHGVGKINNRALKSCRNPHLKDLLQVFPFKSKSGKTELIAAFRFIQAY